MRGLLFRVVSGGEVVVPEHEVTLVLGDDPVGSMAESAAERTREWVDRHGRAAVLQVRDPDGVLLRDEWTDACWVWP